MLNSETVLIVDDDPGMLRGLKDNFEVEGYRVHTAEDGENALLTAVNDRPDLIILDIMLPKINGYEVCRLIRDDGLEMPIIMLTAKSEESDLLLGLGVGADDYVTKPFSIRELLARSGAFLRRQRCLASRSVEFGDYTLDLASRSLQRDGATVVLTPKEYGVLETLTRHAGRALSREQILRDVWGYSVWVTQRSVDRCITTLRGKIEKDPANPQWIHTVRDLGYRFDLE